MRKRVYILLLAGLTLFTFLIGYYGFKDVVAALAVAGWGLIWVTLFHLVPLFADALGWRSIWGSRERPSLLVLIWARWIGEAVDGLLPVAQVGGALVKARLITQRGFPGSVAGASVVAELTVAVSTLTVFSLMGVGLLLSIGGREMVTAVFVGLIVLGSLIAGFYIAQRRGLFGLIATAMTRLAGDRDWYSLVGGATAVDQTILSIYQDRKAMLSSCGWFMAGWLLGTGEVWLAMLFLGAPVSLADALLLESLGQAIRSAAFLIPAQLGVQEGGFVVLGGLLGITPELALALSLTKRVRVLLLGVPGLIAWQITEGKRILAKHSEIV